MEGDGDTNCYWFLSNGLQRPDKRKLEELEIRGRIETI